jgi:hypothetical protein
MWSSVVSLVYDVWEGESHLPDMSITNEINLGNPITTMQRS